MFITIDLMQADIEEKYNDLMMKLSKNDKFYEVKVSAIKSGRRQSLDSLESFDKKIKRMEKK